MKIVATDLQSCFHVISTLAVIGSIGNDSDEDISLHIKSNGSGAYCIPEGVMEAFGLKIKIVHQKECSRNLLSWFGLFFRFCFFLLNRTFVKQGERRYFIHHTYFKPTMLFYGKTGFFYVPTVISFEEGVGTYGGYQHHLRTRHTEGKRFAGLKYFGRRFLTSLVDREFRVLVGASSFDKELFDNAVIALGNYMCWNELVRERSE